MDARRRAALVWLALLAPIGAAQADPKADALFARARRIATRMRTLQAEGIIRAMMDGKTFSGLISLRLMKPDLGWITLKGSDGEANVLKIFKGDEILTVRMAEKEFQREPEGAGTGLMGVYGVDFPPVRAFYFPAFLTAGPEYKNAGTRTVNRKTYQVVEVHGEAPPEGYVGYVPESYFFGPDGFLEGTEGEMREPRRSSPFSFWLREVKRDLPMTAEQFSYTPPADFKSIPLGGPEADRARGAAYFLKVGTRAPDFRLPTLDGSELSLTAARKGKKAVLINFWFYQ